MNKSCIAAPVPMFSRSAFGCTAEGRIVELFTLRNARGVEARLTNFGGKLVSLRVPDRQGHVADIVLGYGTYAAYVHGNPYFGAIVGRYANRIAHGRFSLDGREYQLATNNGPHALHGGPAKGFHNVLWDAVEHCGEDFAGIELAYTAEDGEEGYPGRLECRVTYTLNDQNELEIGYRAWTTRPTPINLTHHSFFNLRGAGRGDILDHRLAIFAERFTPVDATLIPTGELRAVAGSPFDFRTPCAIGARIGDDDPQLKHGRGYDHNYVLDAGLAAEPQLAATVVDPASGRRMDLYTTEPGLQFYSGNFLDGPDRGRRAAHRFRSAFCLEPQHFPDSPNQPAFPDTILRPGVEWTSRTRYRFSLEEEQP
ncbi:aldose 1-epimerase [Geothrix limicola]|uniref:Aldose 1-epimerase n=1 Tax=Geothrix limicola TaxID=2927978 RepID=A0ABQ5QCB6_9BACT|nr:aldose epimerase family protein [Geothrix limicola]GLH71699.1 aldose 1-epimerase [Geothrix limicola]